MTLHRTRPASRTDSSATAGSRPHPRLLRAFGVLGALALSLTGLEHPAASAGEGHLKATPSEYLIAADPAAEEVYVYRTSDMRRTGQLDDVKLGSHVGTLQLPDGRLLMVDDAHAKVLAVSLNADGKPRIVASVAIPQGDRPWQRAGWAAADPKLRYLAVGSDYEGAASQTVTLIDLHTFAAHQITVPLTPNAAGAYAETQVYLAGRPLQLVVTTGGAFQTFPVAPILAGGSPAPTSSAPLGLNNHGPVVTRRGDAVLSTTADGFSRAALPGATLTGATSASYSTTRNVVQNYRPRLAADNRTVWGAVAEDTGLPASAWQDTRNDVSITDSMTLRTMLVRLPDGNPSRFALSRTYGAVATQHPDGDTVTLLDTDPASGTYRRIVGTVALAPLSGGPTPGNPIAGTQGRFVTASLGGNRVYVSNGGDGSITVIDTASRRAVRTILTPTALPAGGYLTTVRAGTPVTDLIAR